MILIMTYIIDEYNFNVLNYLFFYSFDKNILIAHVNYLFINMV